MAVKFRSIQSATNVDGTSATSVTVTRPALVAEGDVMLAISYGYISDALTPPAGWVLIDIASDSGADLRSRLYRKIATSSEPANYTFNFNGAGSSIGVTIAAFMGGYDIDQYQWTVTTTADPASGVNLDAARDGAGFQAYAWRNSTANTSVTWSGGVEKSDLSTKATGAVYRGLSTTYYGPSDFSDIINAGDEFATFTANPVTTPEAGIFWNILIGDKKPDNEAWSATDGAFGVEVNLDRVALDATGGITTRFTRDYTPNVTAFFASAQDEAASRAADGRPETNWRDSTTAAPQFLTYDFGTAFTAKRYRIRSADANATVTDQADPMSWTVEGSNNNSTWTVLDTRLNESFGTRGEVREFKLATTGSFRYYKLNISANKSSGSITGSQIAEWRLSTVNVWEDITPYVQFEDKVRITRGLQGTSGRSDFSRAYFTLDNTDGRFSLRNPNGAYHGALQRNSGTRISKAYGAKALQLQGYVAVEGTDMVGDCIRTPSTLANAVTGDFDLRMDLEPEAWRQTQSLAGISSPGGRRSWDVYLDADARLHLRWTPLAGSPETHVVSTVPVPQGARQSIRIAFDMNDGSGNSVTTFYTASTFNGTWVQLGAPVTAAGGTSIRYRGGMLCVGHVGSIGLRGFHGRIFNFELRNSIGGTLVSDIDFTALTNGTKSFTDSNSNMWIPVGNAVVSNRHYRFHGEHSSWPTAWDPTGNWIYVATTGAGVQKRLERGPATGSAMRRHNTLGIAQNPGFDYQQGTSIAYWPMEDKKNSFQCASALSSRPHLEIYGSPKFEAFSNFNESDSLPDLNGAKFSGRIIESDPLVCDVRFMLDVSEDGAAPTVGANFLTLWGSGVQDMFRLYYSAANTWKWELYPEENLESGVPGVVSADIPVTTVGEKMHVRVRVAQNGGNVEVLVDARNTAGEDLGGAFGATVTTFGSVYRVQVNDDDTAQNTGIGMGHLAIYGSTGTDWEAPINAWHYETAAARVQRICAEEQLQFRLTGDADTSAFLGYQTNGSPQEIMSSAAVSDFGYLVDPLDAFGVEYRTDRSIMSQDPRLTLSYESGDLSNELLPVDDDSYIVNSATASRGDAGSATFILEEGDLSVQAPPYGVGTYADSQSYSLAHEGQCVDIASWMVHQGTLDEEHYPRISVALENRRIAASPTKIEAILGLDIGQRVDITDTPDFLPARDIRQIIIGYEEWFDQFQHQFSLNTIPERIFEVARYSDSSRFDTAGSELYADVSSSATSISVDTTRGPVWSIDPAAIPIDLDVDGELMRVTAVGRLISSNPFFDTNMTGWSVSTGTSVSRETDYVHYYEQAVASAKIVPDGVSVSVDLLNASSPVASVTGLQQYEASAWVYTPTGYSNVGVAVTWRDAANAFISSSIGSANVIPAGVWTHISQMFQAPATASRAGMRVRVAGTPAITDIVWAYSVRLIEESEDTAFTFDSFNRVDSPTNLSFTDDGVIQAWVQNTGTWGINGNAAYISVAGNSIATVAGTADFNWLEVAMSSWASGEGWLNFRFTDTNNRIRFGGTVGGGAQCQIISGGVTTRTATADTGVFPLAAGDLLQVRAQGSVIECYVNNRLALTLTDTTNLTATRVGIQTATTVPRFNNFTFDPLADPQTFTVVRGVNGVTAPHPSGTPVKLNDTPYRGL